MSGIVTRYWFELATINHKQSQEIKLFTLPPFFSRAPCAQFPRYSPPFMPAPKNPSAPLRWFVVVIDVQYCPRDCCVAVIILGVTVVVGDLGITPFRERCTIRKPFMYS